MHTMYQSNYDTIMLTHEGTVNDKSFEGEKFCGLLGS